MVHAFLRLIYAQMSFYLDLILQGVCGTDMWRGGQQCNGRQEWGGHSAWLTDVLNEDSITCERSFRTQAPVIHKTDKVLNIHPSVQHKIQDLGGHLWTPAARALR